MRVCRGPDGISNWIERALRWARSSRRLLLAERRRAGPISTVVLLMAMLQVTACSVEPSRPVGLERPALDGLPLAQPTPLTRDTVTPTKRPEAVRAQTPTIREVAAQATLSPTGTSSPTESPTDPFVKLTPLALTPTRTPEPPGPPQRLKIPAIGLDVPIYPVGLDSQGRPIVLRHDVAWYDRSGTPGAGTNIVLWAHVLRFKNKPKIPAPFARVHELRVGDQLMVQTSRGRQVRFVVTAQIRALPHQVEYLLPTPLERLTLISCIGANVIVDGVLTKQERLVTIAEPLS